MYISGFRYVIYLLIFIIDVIIMVCYGRVWTYWIVDRYGRYRTFFFFVFLFRIGMKILFEYRFV